MVDIENLKIENPANRFALEKNGINLFILVFLKKENQKLLNRFQNQDQLFFVFTITNKETDQKVTDLLQPIQIKLGPIVKESKLEISSDNSIQIIFSNRSSSYFSREYDACLILKITNKSAYIVVLNKPSYRYHLYITGQNIQYWREFFSREKKTEYMHIDIEETIHKTFCLPLAGTFDSE